MWHCLCRRNINIVFLFQILVLQRVSILEVKHLSSPEDTEHTMWMNPLSSNIYSKSEQILLAWLNRLYEIERKVVWKDCKKGEGEEEILFTFSFVVFSYFESCL